MRLEPPIRERSFAEVLRIIDQWTVGRATTISKHPADAGGGGKNLEITRLFIDRLNMNDHLRKLRCVHVAGTKGKGTTCAYASSLLQSHGYRVGLFTSPHIVDVRERILINNSFLTKESFSHYFFLLFDRISNFSQSESQLTRDLLHSLNFFRFMFLLSLYIFMQESVDVAVIEAGIGGRLDVTNVVSSEVTLITSLGLDHTNILGETIEEIASEKAGIMKPGVICYTTPQQFYPSSLHVLQSCSQRVKAPLVVVNEETFPFLSWPDLSIRGEHVVENSKLGLLAARFIAKIPPTVPLNEHERYVLENMTFPGRSQVLPLRSRNDVTFYFDGAHTFESLTFATRWFLRESGGYTRDESPRRVLVFYSSRSPHRVLRAFMPHVHAFSKVIFAFLVNPRTARRDAADDGVAYARGEVSLLEKTWREMYAETPCVACTKPFSSLQELIHFVTPTEEKKSGGEEDVTMKPAQVFVTGSFFLLGDVMKLVNEHEANSQLKEEGAGGKQGGGENAETST